MELAREQRGQFTLIPHDAGFKADIDGDPVSFAPPEWVILRKLQLFGRRSVKNEKRCRAKTPCSAPYGSECLYLSSAAANSFAVPRSGSGALR